MIGIKLEIEEMLASDFSIRFYTEFKDQYLRSKIDGIKKVFEILPEVYFNTVRKFQFDYDKKIILQKFHPESEYKKILARLNTYNKELSPFENAIIENKIKVIQYNRIPEELHKKIQEFIQKYDDSDKKINEIDTLKKELESIFAILIDLLVYAIEYGIQEQRALIIEMKNKLDANLKDDAKEIDSKLQMKTYRALFEEVINKIFKKIYFDIEIDSIKSIDPILPEDPGYELFGDIIDIMQSIFNSLYLLRGTINLSFLLDKPIFIPYLVSKCSNYLYYVKLDFDELVRLSKESLEIDVDMLTRDDRFNVKPYISNLKSELERDQLEEDRGVRYLNLKQNLETFFDIEDKITKLFKIVMIKGLELKRYGSYTDRDNDNNNINKKIQLRDNSNNNFKKLLKEINDIEKELVDNSDTKNILTFTFPKISQLLTKINEIDDLHNNTSFFVFDEIYSIYQRTYETIDKLYWSLRSSSIDYPYLFPELAELRDFFRFRLGVFDKKREREIIIQINSLFKERKYEQVLMFKANKYVKDNPKILTKIGLAQYYLKEYNEAIKVFDSILKVNKSNPHILFNLGLSYQQISDCDTKIIEKSIRYFEESIIDDYKNNTNSYTALGILNFNLYKITNLHDFKAKSLNYIEKATNSTANSDWTVLLARGCILSGFEEYDEAHICFLKSEELNPNSLVVKLNRLQNMIIIACSKKEVQDIDSGLEEVIDELNHIFETMKNIENRSAKIIILILLVLSNLLSNGDIYRNATISRELLRLFSLKDSKLIDWDFDNLVMFLQKEPHVSEQNKEFIKKILSIPGKKSKNEVVIIKQNLSDFINKFQPNKIEYVDDTDNRISINIQIEKKIEINNNNNNHNIENETIKQYCYIWKISIIKGQEFPNNEKISFVLYEFDPTFKNNIQIVDSRHGLEDFEIKAIGWEGTKVEITINLESKTVWKKVVALPG